MDFEVLYKLDFGSFQWQVLLIPISLIILGIYAIRLIKRYGFKHPMQVLGFFPDLNFSMFGKFFAFLFAFFGFIILIGLLVRIPIDLIERIKVKDKIENNDFKITEGRVEHFSSSSGLGNEYESFEINGVLFSFSNSEDFYGYSKTSTKGGIINSNGQYFRISYYYMDGRNIIFKIEGVKNH